MQLLWKWSGHQLWLHLVAPNGASVVMMTYQPPLLTTCRPDQIVHYYLILILFQWWCITLQFDVTISESGHYFKGSSLPTILPCDEPHLKSFNTILYWSLLCRWLLDKDNQSFAPALQDTLFYFGRRFWTGTCLLPTKCWRTQRSWVPHRLRHIQQSCMSYICGTTQLWFAAVLDLVLATHREGLTAQ